MDNSQNAFFYQIQPISDNSTVFEKLTNQQLFFSYFQVDQKYYLFFYGQKSIEINPIESLISILHELDTKQRTIRSLRGFFRYALEIMDNGKVEFLKTNLQPFFWRKVRKILKQNKKEVLLQFLFGSQIFQINQSDLKDKIQSLESQLSSLQQKVLNLEAKLMRFEQNSKYPLSEPSRPRESSKTSQQGDSTLKSEKAPYLTENGSEVRDSTSRGKDMESKSFSDASKIDFNTLSNSTGYNMPSHLEKGLKTALRFGNQPNFITLGKISEDEKIEIIQKGFQLQAEGKISLKKYYERVSEANSLFQSKGYSIKYESIRRTKLYQQLKP